MIRINPDRIRVIDLTPKEQKTILNYCRSMSRDMYERIRTARNGVLHLLEEELIRPQIMYHRSLESSLRSVSCIAEVEA